MLKCALMTASDKPCLLLRSSAARAAATVFVSLCFMSHHLEDSFFVLYAFSQFTESTEIACSILQYNPSVAQYAPINF